MNPVRSSWVAAAALMIAAGATNAPAGQDSAPDYPLYILKWEHAALRDGFSAERLLNKIEVRAPSGKRIGTIDDLVVEKGLRVCAILVDAAGDMRLRVSWSDVTPDTALRFVTVAVHSDHYRSAVSSRNAHDPVKPHEWRATELIGEYVTLDDGQPYGRVDDLLIARSGRIEALVVNTSGSPGAERLHSAHPLRHLEPGEVMQPEASDSHASTVLDRSRYALPPVLSPSAPLLPAARGAADAPADALSPAAGRPVSSMLAEHGEGARVVVRGRVQEVSGAAEYVLVDNTGSMRVRIPPALLQGGVALMPGTHVEVLGVVAAMPGRGYELHARRVVIRRAAAGPLGTGRVQIR